MDTKENIEKRKQMCWSNLSYSAQRMDLLIISVSGAGVYVVLETLKYVVEKKFTDTYIIKLAGVLFILTVMINIVSQIFGKRANNYDYLMCEAKLKAQNPPTDEESESITILDGKAQRNDTITSNLNTTSIITMFLGLIGMILYYIISI